MPVIEIAFGPNGEVEVEAMDFKGQSCKEATAFIEETLGTVQDIQLKMEWYQENEDRIVRERDFGFAPEKICG